MDKTIKKLLRITVVSCVCIPIGLLVGFTTNRYVFTVIGLFIPLAIAFIAWASMIWKSTGDYNG